MVVGGWYGGGGWCGGIVLTCFGVFLVGGIFCVRFLSLSLSLLLPPLTQLCINYANECLQQQFNTDTFKTETDIYLQEGVSDLVGEIKFADNQDVLTIIAGKGGVLRMLDEEIKLGTRGSSEVRCCFETSVF